MCLCGVSSKAKVVIVRNSSTHLACSIESHSGGFLAGPASIIHKPFVDDAVCDVLVLGWKRVTASYLMLVRCLEPLGISRITLTIVCVFWPPVLVNWCIVRLTPLLFYRHQDGHSKGCGKHRYQNNQTMG